MNIFSQAFKEFFTKYLLLPLIVLGGSFLLCMIADLVAAPFKGGLFGLVILGCMYIGKRLNCHAQETAQRLLDKKNDK